MPSFETMDRHQQAVVWLATGINDDYGRPKVSAQGQEIKVRWITKRMETLDAQGNPIALDATVVVDQEIPIGSVMWQGGLNDLPGTAPPEDRVPASGIMEVVTTSTTPDIKNRNIRRTLGLKRLSDTMPST